MSVSSSLTFLKYYTNFKQEKLISSTNWGGGKMKGVPVEKYLELQKEFPNRFVYFFNVNGELNAEGKMATENLAMRNLLKRLEFVFYPEKELLHVTLTRISAPYDESEGNLNKIAGDIVAGCGIVPFPVRIVGA